MAVKESYPVKKKKPGTFLGVRKTLTSGAVIDLHIKTARPSP